MENEFKQQQHDRIEEGKELMHEDQMRDLSQIPPKELPGGNTLLSKIGQGLSNVASTISEKVGLSEPTIEGHEELDQATRKQVKKLNKEVRKHAEEKGPEVEKHSEWENPLPKHEIKQEVAEVADKAKEAAPKTSFVDKVKEGVHNLFAGHKKEEKIDDGLVHSEWEKPLPKHEVKEEVEDVKEKVTEVTDKAKEAAPKTSIVHKVKEGVHGLSESIAHGADNLKQRFHKEEESNEDGTKRYTVVKDGIKESVDDLKHEQRVAELGQEELSSQNPFQPLTSESNEEGENRTLGEKLKGGLNDASQKISSTVGGATQKVKSVFVHKEANAVDKENAQQTA